MLPVLLFEIKEKSKPAKKPKKETGEGGPKKRTG